MVEAYADGVSTRGMALRAQALGVASLSSSAVSRLASELDSQVEGLRSRDLGDQRYCYLWVDATYVRCRVGGRSVSQAVVTAIALGEDGGCYNVNADMVAGHIAAAIGAHKVVFLTDVDGLYENFEDKSTLISNLTLFEAQYLIENDVVSTGMIPKLKSCVTALDAGVFRAHILNGTTPHSLLLELLTSTGVGTTMHSTEEACKFDAHPLGNFASKLLENREQAAAQAAAAERFVG